MSAITGIGTSGTLGSRTLPETRWQDRVRSRPVAQKKNDADSGSGFSGATQFLLSLLYTLAMLPLMAIGAVLALILVPWLILTPALVAGLVIVIVSFVIGGLG